jgi:hypothetical protein
MNELIGVSVGLPGEHGEKVTNARMRAHFKEVANKVKPSERTRSYE